jgi:hypothetical protein
MNIAASFSLSKKPRFNRPGGDRNTTEGDAHKLRDALTRAPLMVWSLEAFCLVLVSYASSGCGW